MAEKVVTKTLGTISSEIAGFMETIRTAIKEKKPDVVYTAIEALGVSEKEYAKVKEASTYREIGAMENPLAEAVKRYSYEVIRHTIERGDDGSILSVTLTKAERQIDLFKFCKVNSLPTLWAYMAQKLNQLLCLRTARELKMSPEAIRELALSYFLREEVKRIELGEVPDSNTKLQSMLKKVVAEMLPDAGVKVNLHDVKYLLACYTRKNNKQKLTVNVARDSLVYRLLMDVCYRILTDSHYTVDGFRHVKGEAITVRSTATEKTIAAEAEQAQPAAAAQPAAKKAAQPAAKKAAQPAAKKAASAKAAA